MKSNGHLVTDSVGRAELLVDKFQLVFTKEDNQPLPNVSRRVKEDIPTLNIGEEGVRKLLQNIKINKAAGPDEFPNQFSKNAPTKLPLPLLQFSNELLTPVSSQKTGEKLTSHPYLKKVTVIYRKTTALFL